MKRHHWIIGVVGALLAVAGVTEQTDGIVRYVTQVVNGIGWTDLWKPVFDPPPMNTYTYRPLTVAVVKLELWITGGDTMWMTALHSLTIPWLGFAVHRFLRVHGLERVALWTALSSMMLPSMLFAGWIPVESDGLGAIFLCEAGWAIRRWRADAHRKHLIILVLAAFGAATTKETSAAAFFGYLLMDAWQFYQSDGKRALWPLVIYGIGLAALVTPFLMAQPPNPHAFHVEHNEFSLGNVFWMLVHNNTQLFYVTSSAGAALLILLRRPGKYWLIGAALLLLAAPPLRVYNHYESVVIDQLFYVGPFGLVLIGAMIWSLFRGTPTERTLAGTFLFLVCTLVVAPIIALQSRPDVSARLYAPVIPVIHGLAWMGALTLLDTYRGQKLAPVAWFVVLCFALFPLAGAANMVSSFRARMLVEHEAKHTLVDLLNEHGAECPVIIAPNRDHELAIEELEALGVTWSACSEIFVPNVIQLDPSDADLLEWRMQGHRYSLKPPDVSDIEAALSARKAPARCVYLYIQTPRAMMDTSDFRRFAGDFAWAFDHLPEFDEDVYTQQIEIQFREITITEKLFRLAGATERASESTYNLYPLNPNEFLGRLLMGLPIIETYAYEGRNLFFEACATE